MSSRFHAMLFTIATLTTACASSTNDTPGGAPTRVHAVTKGTLVQLQLPFFSANITGQFPSGMLVESFDSQDLLNGIPKATDRMGFSPLVTSSACLKSGCGYAMGLNANDTKLPFGVVTFLDDGVGGSTFDDSAYTTALSNAVLNAEEPNQAITNVVTFAVPKSTLTTAATALGLASADAVVKQGLLIGMVVERQSDASPQNLGLPAPVNQAQVSLVSTTANAPLYSAGDYSGAAPTGTKEVATNADGIFFATVNAAAGTKPQQLQFNVSASGHAWNTQTTVLAPNVVTVAVFYAR